MSQFGEVDIANFDRAIYEALHADFLPFPNPNDVEVLKRPMRQVRIEGLCGPGYIDDGETDGRIPVVFDTPEDIYNRYLLPGIRVKRNESIDNDDSRRFGWLAGFKYRAPSDNGQDVTVGEQCGRTHYVQREHAEPVFITYDIEVRARYEREAQIMRKFVRRHLKHEMFLEVRDDMDETSWYTIFREGDSSTDEFISSLNRFHGYMLTYRVEAEIDDYEEQEFRALTSTPETHFDSDF